MIREVLVIAKIDIGDRERKIDPCMVEALKFDMLEKGQLTPIIVRITGASRYALIAGAHRIEAQKRLGHPNIVATVAEVNRHQAKIIEIDENILRLPFAPLEFAKAMARRKELYEVAYPETKNGARGLIATNSGHQIKDNSGSAQTPTKRDISPERQNVVLDESGHQIKDSSRSGFSTNTSERLGVSKRQIERAIWLATHFTYNAEKILKDHPILNNASQLHAMARLRPNAQEKAARLIKSGKCNSVAEAIAWMENRLIPSPQEKIYSKLLDNWERTSARQKRDFLNQLSWGRLPAGYKVIRPDRGDQ